MRRSSSWGIRRRKEPEIAKRSSRKPTIAAVQVHRQRPRIQRAPESEAESESETEVEVEVEGEGKENIEAEARALEVVELLDQEECH